MAIGGLISYQNFSSFIGSGRGCRTEQAISRQRGERLGTVMSQHCPVNAFLRNSTNLGDRSSLHWCSFNHYPYDEGLWNRPLFSQYDCLDIQIRQRTQRNCKCSLHSGSFRGSWIRPRSKDELNNGCGLKSGNIRVKRLKAHYKSEEYDMTEANVDALTAAEGWSEAVLVEGNVQEVSPWWEQFPKRWVIVLLCFSAFLLCNMDRVVGGIWADRIGGKVVLGFGVVWWSVATVLTPIVARIGLPFLLVTRAFMVIGEGVAMPAMNNILSKWIPVSERSRSLALVYSGMYLGSVTGLAFSPILIKYFGWPSVFYTFGSLGSIWFAFWLRKAYSSPKDDAEVSIAEKKLILDGGTSKEPVSVIPWRLILSKAPVWALIISHFCHNWGTFILLTWMPTYYNQVLKFNLTESGLLCALPWLTMAIFANIGGWIADTLVSKGLSITAVRKAGFFQVFNADYIPSSLVQSIK